MDKMSCMPCRHSGTHTYTCCRSHWGCRFAFGTTHYIEFQWWDSSNKAGCRRGAAGLSAKHCFGPRLDPSLKVLRPHNRGQVTYVLDCTLSTILRWHGGRASGRRRAGPCLQPVPTMSIWLTSKRTCSLDAETKNAMESRVLYLGRQMKSSASFPTGQASHCEPQAAACENSLQAASCLLCPG